MKKWIHIRMIITSLLQHSAIRLQFALQLLLYKMVLKPSWKHWYTCYCIYIILMNFEDKNIWVNLANCSATKSPRTFLKIKKDGIYWSIYLSMLSFSYLNLESTIKWGFQWTISKTFITWRSTMKLRATHTILLWKVKILGNI